MIEFPANELSSISIRFGGGGDRGLPDTRSRWTAIWIHPTFTRRETVLNSGLQCTAPLPTCRDAVQGQRDLIPPEDQRTIRQPCQRFNLHAGLAFFLDQRDLTGVAVYDKGSCLLRVCNSRYNNEDNA